MKTNSFLKSIATIVLISFVTIILCEFSLALYSAKTTGSFKSAAELNNIFLSPIFSSPGSKNCAWGDAIGPHPYIGYFYSNFSDCPDKFKNNYGFKGQQAPHIYDENYYSIMVLGGSVAEQIGIFRNPEKKIIFETYINENYISPNGKPFKVLNYAMAGSHQPVAFITSGLFIDRVDEIISIEGYNESRHIINAGWLENPPRAWMEIAAAQYAPITYAGLKFTLKALRKVSRSPLKYSYTIFYTLKVLTNVLSKKFEKNEFDSNPFAEPYNTIPGELREKIKLIGYVKYTDNIEALAVFNKKPFTVLLQPFPLKNKILTPEESNYIANINLDGNKISEVYNYLIKYSKADIVSLEKIFIKTTEQVYVDDIHFNSIGIKIMSSAIADIVSKKNGWKRRK